MRKLKVEISKATQGKYVHVVTGIDEKRMLGPSKPPSLAQAVTEVAQEDEPDDIIAGGDCCVDEEADWDSCLY